MIVHLRCLNNSTKVQKEIRRPVEYCVKNDWKLRPKKIKIRSGDGEWKREKWRRVNPFTAIEQLLLLNRNKIRRLVVNTASKWLIVRKYEKRATKQHLNDRCRCSPTARSKIRSVVDKWDINLSIDSTREVSGIQSP